MNEKQIDILLRRERLRERIRHQRTEMAQQVRPVVVTLAVGDTIAGTVRCLGEHPLTLACSVAALALWRPKGVFRWGRRAFVAWRSWRFLRGRLDDAIVALRSTLKRKPGRDAR